VAEPKYPRAEWLRSATPSASSCVRKADAPVGAKAGVCACVCTRICAWVEHG
jgi:hypothetical protein